MTINHVQVPKGLIVASRIGQVYVHRSGNMPQSTMEACVPDKRNNSEERKQEKFGVRPIYDTQ